MSATLLPRGRTRLHNGGATLDGAKDKVMEAVTGQRKKIEHLIVVKAQAV